MIVYRNDLFDLYSDVELELAYVNAEVSLNDFNFYVERLETALDIMGWSEGNFLLACQVRVLERLWDEAILLQLECLNRGIFRIE
jgi:hypothetical protein